MNFAANLAEQAGQLIKTNFTKQQHPQWKSDDSPVTATDIEINNLVVNSIKKEFPHHSVIAEEGGYDVHDSEYIWVCDPLDGTVAFAHNIPTCTFSLALTHNGKSILGVVYDPFLQRMYTAQAGKGAFINGLPMHVSAEHQFKHTMIGIPVWDKFFYKDIPLVKAVRDSGAFNFNACAIVYMGTLVAHGDLGAAIYLDTAPYDVAALKVIVEEAGGKVTDLYGHEQNYNVSVKGAIISNQELHPQLITMVHDTILTE